MFDAVEVITLFVDELRACKTFYAEVFGARFVYEEAVLWNARNL
jgi:catechol 2,3-dioxygenase-like lactoylglutathione lyase family enzyme